MKKIFLIGVAISLSISSFSAVYLVETGSGNGTDAVWHKAGAGEVNVSLASTSTNLNSWIATAVAGDEVWIASGEYLTSGTVSMVAGVNYYGGFRGVESKLSERVKSDLDKNGIVDSWEYTYQSVISAQATVASRFSCATMGNCLADGLCLQGGISTQASGVSLLGAANAPATIVNSIIRKNRVTNLSGTCRGGGVRLQAYSTVQSCLIEDNWIDNLKNDGTTNNEATYGAGIALDNATALLVNSVIRNNRNLGSSGGNCQGGGVYASGRVLNCLIYNNVSNGRGAGVYMVNNAAPGLSVDYCTIVNNQSVTNSGGGVYMYASNGSGLRNSVVHGNTSNTTALSNLFVETRTSAAILLGSVACNGNSTIGGSYTTLPGTSVKADLSASDIFVKPTATVGYIENATTWDCDWRLADKSGSNLGFGVPIAVSGEADFLGVPRRDTLSYLGAIETEVIPKYRLTLVANAEGTVSGGGDYQGSEGVAIRALPAQGYSFVKWMDESGDSILFANPLYAMPLKAKTLTASFVLDPIVVKPEDGEVVINNPAPNVALTVQAGGKAKLTSASPLSLGDVTIKVGSNGNAGEINASAVSVDHVASIDLVQTLNPSSSTKIVWNSVALPFVPTRVTDQNGREMVLGSWTSTEFQPNKLVGGAYAAVTYDGANRANDGLEDKAELKNWRFVTAYRSTLTEYADFYLVAVGSDVTELHFYTNNTDWVKRPFTIAQSTQILSENSGTAEVGHWGWNIGGTSALYATSTNLTQPNGQTPAYVQSFNSNSQSYLPLLAVSTVAPYTVYLSKYVPAAPSGAPSSASQQPTIRFAFELINEQGVLLDRVYSTIGVNDLRLNVPKMVQGTEETRMALLEQGSAYCALNSTQGNTSFDLRVVTKNLSDVRLRLAQTDDNYIVSLNGTLLRSGETITPQAANALLIQRVTTSVDQPTTGVKIVAVGRVLHLSGLVAGEVIEVVNTLGQSVVRTQAIGETQTIRLQTPGIYLVNGTKLIVN